MSPILPGSTLGVLGSGQLGRMFAIAARRLGYRVHVLSPDDDTPTGPSRRRCRFQRLTTISMRSPSSLVVFPSSRLSLKMSPLQPRKSASVLPQSAPAAMSSTPPKIASAKNRF